MPLNSRIEKFKRVTDLFEQGKVVVLSDDPEDPLLVWVNKLNPFEQDECRKDGAVGRARALERLTVEDSPEAQVMRAALADRGRDHLVEALVSQRSNEFYVRSLDEIRTMEEWQDKLLILDRADAQMMDAGLPEDAEENTRLAALNAEYMGAVNALMESYVEDARTEYGALTDEQLREAFMDTYKESTGSAGFLNEYRITEMYFSLRDCQGKSDGYGGWTHAGCNHRERLCETRAAIRELPEELIARVRDAILTLSMSPKDAGNSDAPASSSASSERPKQAAESTPSTPAAT